MAIWVPDEWPPSSDDRVEAYRRLIRRYALGQMWQRVPKPEFLSVKQAQRIRQGVYDNLREEFPGRSFNLK